MLKFRRPAVALLVLIALWPTLVLGQDRAGVVTTLEGVATVTRAAIAQPVALKFKDDVFLNDRVVTGDRSLARMLLGGRAVVTVRERSALTISEIPGRSTIELTTGKMALAVAREKMRPGDVIEIRTPNAIAGVRGTVVVAEVFQAGAQAGGGGVSVVTRLHVLRGGIDVSQLDPATGRPLTAPQPLNVLQTFSVTGGAPGTITPISQDQVEGITAGLQPSGPQHKAGTNQEHVAEQQMGTAVQLANALSGAGQPLQTNVTDTTPLTTTTDQPQGAPLTPLSGGGGTLAPIAPTPDASDLRITGTLTLDAGQTLRTFDTDVNRFLTSPMIEIANAMVSQLGPDNLIQVNDEVSVFLASPLLRVIDSTVLPGGDLLRVFGLLVSGSPAALVSLDPTTVTTPGNFITVTGALGTAGPLVTDAGGTLTAGGDLVAVLDGGVLLSITPDALLQLNGSTVVVGADGDHTHLFRVAGGFDERPQVILAGPLLAAVNADVTARGFAFLEVFDGVLSSTTTAPLINVSGGSLAFGPGAHPVFLQSASLDTAGALFKASGADISTPTTPFVSLSGASLTTGGPLLDLTGVTLDLGGQPLVLSSSGSFVTVTGGPVIRLANSTLTADTLSTSDGSGNGFDLRGPLLDLTNSSSLTVREIGDEPTSSTDVANITLAPNEPAIRLVDSILTVTGGEHVLSLGVDAGPIPSVQGAALSATRSTVSVAGVLLDLGGVTLVDSDPQLQLTDSTLTQTTGASPLIEAFGRPVRLAGPLLSATGGSITTAAGLLRVGNGSLRSGTSDAFIQIEDGALDVGGNVVRLDPGARLTLGGSLLTARSSTLNVAGSLLSVTNGAQVMVTGSTDPFVSLAGGEHGIAGAGRAMVELSGRGTATAVSDEEDVLTLGTDQPLQYGGVLLDTTGATVSVNRGLRIDTALLEASAPLLRLRGGSEFTTNQDALELSFQAKVTSLGPLVSLNGSMMTVVNGAAVTVAGGSFLNVGGDLVSLANGSTLSILNGPALSVLGGSVVRINGGLLRFTGTGNVVNITNNLCTPCTPISGIPVALTNGAMANQLSLSGNVIKSLEGNTLNVSGAVIKVDGAGSKVKVRGL
ncbi:MAG TPA: FecR domain-containing protein [Candidatus Limnocylindria bacterium]|nr:FecR domain-containing protein [Candidatus Limnocylindria bacterium]